MLLSTQLPVNQLTSVILLDVTNSLVVFKPPLSVTSLTIVPSQPVIPTGTMLPSPENTNVSVPLLPPNVTRSKFAELTLLWLQV